MSCSKLVCFSHKEKFNHMFQNYGDAHLIFICTLQDIVIYEDILSLELNAINLLK